MNIVTVDKDALIRAIYANTDANEQEARSIIGFALTSPVAPEQVVAAPKAQWEDPRVQAVYDVLCSDEVPPAGQHWEGWAARRIADALSPEAAPTAMEGCQRPNVACAAPECGADCRFSPAATPAAPSAEASPGDDLLVACITLNGTTLTVEASALADMFGTDDEQHAYELTFKRMTRAAFEALGEFNGF